VDQQRGAATTATLGYTLDAWLEVHEVESSTLDGCYRGYVERTTKPALGEVPIPMMTARMLEQFYAQLRRYRVRCNGKQPVAADWEQDDDWIRRAQSCLPRTGAVMSHRWWRSWG